MEDLIEDFLHSYGWIFSSIAMLIVIILALIMGIQDLRDNFMPFFSKITIILAVLMTVCLSIIVYINVIRLLIK